MLFGLGIYRAPIALAWHDSPLAVKFLIEAEGKSGVSYQMPPSSLAPYDLVFAQGRFHFMDDEKAIIGVLGASSDRQVVDHLKDVEDLAALNELKENKGTPRLDVARTEDFKRLVRARLHLEHSDAPNLFSRMPRPPQHIWSYSDPRFGWDEYTGQEPIRRVRVRRIEAIHTNGNNRILSNKVLCEFDV
jgi:hypothetical protein